MDFRNYFKLPLKVHHGKVFTNDGKMAFDFIASWHIPEQEKDEYIIIPDEVQEDMIELINGREGSCALTASYEDGWVSLDGQKAILIRGWGMLTSYGGYNLESNIAAQIQDEFGSYIANRLNGI